MAVKAAGSVTVASITDVVSTTRYYLLQASTLTAPAKPTAKPPGGSWSATEPTYTEGSTNSLYTCDLTTFSDGTWAYSAVSLSSSYEASKTAYNKAVAAAAAAAATDQHFWADTDGAHVSSTGDHDTSGFHQLMTSVKNAFMHGTTELMTVSENLIELGKNSTSAIIRMCGGSVTIRTAPFETGVPDGGTMDAGVLSSDTMFADVLTKSDAAGYGGETYSKIRARSDYSSTEHLAEVEAGTYHGKTADDWYSYVNFAADEVRVNSTNVAPMDRFLTAIQPVVLYNGGAALTYDTAPGTGTTGTVTLSESAAHFKELTIYYAYNSISSSVVLTNRDAATAGLYLMFVGGEGWLWTKTRNVAVSGTTITTSGNCANTDFNLSAGGYSWAQSLTTPEIAIIRVEGRR